MKEYKGSVEHNDTEVLDILLLKAEIHMRKFEREEALKATNEALELSRIQGASMRIVDALMLKCRVALV